MCGGLFEPSQHTTKSKSTTTYGPSPEYQSVYSNLLTKAQGVAGAAYDPATEQQVAGFAQPTNDAFSGVYANQGVYSPYMQNAFGYAQQGAAPSYTTVQDYMNPYTQNVVDATQQQFDTQNARQINDVRASLAKTGALGGSGRLVSEALTKEAQMNAQNPVIANLYSSGYNQALSAAQTDAARQLSAGGVMGSLGGQAQQYGYNDVNALLGIGGLQQQQQQSVLDAATANAQQRASYPYQQLQWLSGMASGLGSAAGGTQTTSGTQTTPGPSIGQQLIGGGLAALSFMSNGGRVGYDSGGVVAPFGGARSYIPQMGITKGSGPTPSLAEASGTSPNAGGGMADLISSYQQAHSALSGIGRLGEKMRTTTGVESANGSGQSIPRWITTVNPSSMSGWGNYIGNMFGFSRGGGVGRVGYADGGDVLDMEDDGTGTYAVPEAFPGAADLFGGAWDAQPEAFGTGVAAMAPMAATAPQGPAGVAPVTTPETAERGGGLFGWSPEARQALLQAGLGIMASQSPNVGVALGQGGLMGAKAYQGALEQEEARKLQQQKIAQQTAALQQRAQQAAEALKLRREQHESQQRYQGAQIAKMEADMARGDIQQVGNNLVRIAPDGAVSEIYTGKASGTDTNTPESRAIAAEKYGLDPNSDAGRAFILTGKLPREDQQALTATDKKAILEADEMVAANQGAINALSEAERLSPHANQGWFAGARASIGNNLHDYLVPDVISSPESSEATTNLDNAVIGNALAQLKTIFGGNPTEGERKILIDLQGASNQPNSVRLEIFRRAREAASRRLVFNQERAAQLRGGTYYKPQSETGLQPASSGVGGAPIRARNPQTNEEIEWNGQDWVPVQ